MNQSLEKMEWDKADSLIAAAQKVLVIGHARPDSDAIGSMTAVSLALKSLGKQVIMAVDGGTPPLLTFLSGTSNIQPTIEQVDCDLVICVDSSDVQIMGKVGQTVFAEEIPKLIIDHHVTNELFGDAHLVDSTAVSTTDILFKLFKKLNITKSSEIANCLLTGIVGDTLCFRVGPITDKTFAIAANLLEAGADLATIRQHTVEVENPVNTLQLIGIALSRTRIEDGVAWSFLEAADFYQVGHATGKVIGIADTILRTKGAVISAEFAATDEGNVRFSLRAKSGYEVGKIASKLGGGGHTQAGGGTLFGLTAADAAIKVIPMLKSEANNKLN